MEGHQRRPSATRRSHDEARRHQRRHPVPARPGSSRQPSASPHRRRQDGSLPCVPTDGGETVEVRRPRMRGPTIWRATGPSTPPAKGRRAEPNTAPAEERPAHPKPSMPGMYGRGPLLKRRDAPASRNGCPMFTRGVASVAPAPTGRPVAQIQAPEPAPTRPGTAHQRAQPQVIAPHAAEDGRPMGAAGSVKPSSTTATGPHTAKPGPHPWLGSQLCRAIPETPAAPPGPQLAPEKLGTPKPAKPTKPTVRRRSACGRVPDPPVHAGHAAQALPMGRPGLGA
ncbi:hypothetical protein Trydic_g18613 [Trypoxylus dichotomus]